MCIVVGLEEGGKMTDKCPMTDEYLTDEMFFSQFLFKPHCTKSVLCEYMKQLCMWSIVMPWLDNDIMQIGKHAQALLLPT